MQPTKHPEHGVVVLHKSVEGLGQFGVGLGSVNKNTGSKRSTFTTNLSQKYCLEGCNAACTMECPARDTMSAWSGVAASRSDRIS